MADLNQKTIEFFFDQCDVKSAEKKAKLLPLMTDIIYEYNMKVVEYEKEKDEYRRKQIMEDIEEIKKKIMKTCEGDGK